MRLRNRRGRLSQLPARELEFADHDEPAPALERETRVVRPSFQRARQGLERVADAAERHLRPREGQHGVHARGITIEAGARLAQRLLPFPALLARQRRRVERLLQQRHRFGLLEREKGQKNRDHEVLE